MKKKPLKQKNHKKMKASQKQEIEKFVSDLEQNYLSEHQMMTLNVNPEDIVGGQTTNEKDCVNKIMACKTSINNGSCVNDTWIGCGKTSNGGACQNKIR